MRCLACAPLACAVASRRAIAADAEAAFAYVVRDGGAEISGFSNPNDRTANLVIPDSIGGCPVVSIRFNAFFWNSNLRSVTIPNSVTNIGSRAFGCCVNLEAFSVAGEGGALVSVDGILFSRDMTRLVACPGAKERVVVPDSVVSIGRYAFDGCYLMSSVSLPRGLADIDECAFEDCGSLTSLTLPASLESVGEWAFYDTLNIRAIHTDIGDSDRIRELLATSGCSLDVSKIEFIEPWLLGDGVTATLTEHGCLRFDGDGQVPDWPADVGAPWRRHADRIASVAIAPGIVRIGRGAFDGLAPGVTVDGVPLSTYEKVCPSLALGRAAPAAVAHLNVADGKIAMSVRFMVKGALDEREWKDVKAESADVEPDGTVGVRLACPDGSCGFYLLESSHR